MMVPDLPKIKGINLENLSSKEAFKRAIDIFFGCLLADSNSSSGRFNYVCREVLEYLELGVGEDALETNFIDDYMRKMDLKATR